MCESSNFYLRGNLLIVDSSTEPAASINMIVMITINVIGAYSPNINALSICNQQL